MANLTGLLDALDLKAGNGPTAFAMLKQEIERLTNSNKELVEALKIAYQYMHVFIIRNEEPLVGENLTNDAKTVLSLIQKSEGSIK